MPESVAVNGRGGFGLPVFLCGSLGPQRKGWATEISNGSVNMLSGS